MKVESFNNNVIEYIAKILGDTDSGFTGSEIGKLLSDCNIPDLSPTDTKWRRLNTAMIEKQNTDGCANNICNFLQQAMNPVKYCNDQDWYREKLYELNKILSFAGFSIGEDGKLKAVEKVATISEANARASRLKESLLLRNVHQDILLCGREELLVDNYFHAVFEAIKSIAEKIREKTGLIGLLREAPENG